SGLGIFYPLQAQESPNAAAPAPAEIPHGVYDTSMGSIIIELYPDKAPLNVAHFLKQVDNDHYDGIVFHRVMTGFVIQAGSFDENYKEHTINETVDNEARRSVSNKKGTIAMAQKPGDQNSASSDFFINLVDNNHLDYRSAGSMQGRADGYTVFGKVIEGMDVVEKIAAVPVETKKFDDLSYKLENCPVDNIVINEVRRVDDENSIE
ncbi:MAG: hypothetical protein F4166_01795, partial [Gammaproteobacteria bacterium]|nr:hypothetical protein [Gammaproteobacteria bacterium]